MYSGFPETAHLLDIHITWVFTDVTSWKDSLDQLKQLQETCGRV